MRHPEPVPAPSYRERLWPGPWLWVMSAGGVAALAMAYGRALGPTAGWVVAAAGGLVALLLVWRATPEVVVEPGSLRAGRAHLPMRFAGRVIPLDGDGARLARGPEGDPTAYMLLRPGVGPGAVVVEVTDAEDPHRTWLLASRHPTRLASAIESARGTLAP